MKFKQLVEQRLEQMKADREALVERWTPYIGAANEYLKEKEGRELSDMERHNMAQCLENALIEGGVRQKSQLFETTYQDNIQFLGIQLPVIAALIPTLVLNKIAIVQALDRRTGAIFYLDVKYGTTKGGITAADTMISATTGRAATDGSTTKRRYATSRIQDEVIRTGNGTNDNLSGQTAQTTVVRGHTVVRWYHSATAYTMNDFTTAGTLAGTHGSGTISATGLIAASADTGYAATAGTSVTVDYWYDQGKASAGVGEVDINLSYKTLTAEDFKLRANFEMGASFDLEKAHGLVLEDEIVKYLGGEIKFEIDHMGIDMIYDAAVGNDDDTGTAYSPATAIGSWSANPTSGQEWIWKKYEFLDKVELGSNNIFAKTLRGFANFVLTGNNGARVIKQLTNNFKPASGLGSAVPTGPLEIGTLDGKPVIQDPFLPTNTYVLGYKGDGFLFAGFVYAPYIPLFTTPTLITGDLKAQKGFMSSAGFKVVNAGLYTYGTIAGI